MDDTEFKQRIERLEAIGKVLEKLPAEIRADAFSLLQGYVGGESSPPPKRPKKTEKRTAGHDDRDDGSDEEFFSSFDHEEAADNVRLITAYFYREYGSQAFSVEELQQKAGDVGLTVPNRIDMTLLKAAEKGKKLYNRAGRGKWKPTVHGEKFLKATYSVRKGNKKRYDEEGSE